MILSILSLITGLVLGTFVSEDAACLSGGLLASEGRLPLVAAIVACGAGIFLSDVAIILIGRAVAGGGQSRWLRLLSPSPAKIARARIWFERHGGWVVLFSRFVPGTRSATCFAAGLLRVPMKKFSLIFLAASAIWTPVAVGAAYYVGQTAAVIPARFSGVSLLIVLGTISVILIVYKLGAMLVTWRGRRLLLSRWLRLTRWEFWPTWAIYPPVVGYIVWLSLKYRSLTLFTAVNPGIGAGGGLIGESKSEILRGLTKADDGVARWKLVSGDDVASRTAAVVEFMADAQLSFPIVLKPDVGARGAGVVIAHDRNEIEAAVAANPALLIAQAYVPGIEFGVFYYRLPSAKRGEIFAITDKRMVSVTGDGRSTLEQLILSDARAVYMAAFFLKEFEERLSEIPPLGEKVSLSQLGTHCRGALFLDGAELLTPALYQAVEQVSRTFDGFYFGRYDVRSASVDAFRAGEFKIIELNGLTSEATNIYDPRHSVWFGWRTLCQQWRIAFEVAAENRRLGTQPLTVRQVMQLLFGSPPQKTGGASTGLNATVGKRKFLQESPI